MSVYRPSRYPKKRELIEEALKDLNPSIREQARRVLEELDESTLSNRDRVRDFLKKRGIL
ncbi:MAG: hypothetical protein DRO13_01170 [Thermoprotei archaeon]|nr:MAG: hypothetical protein DRO13_01170 [Thermoprotei archaeon]